MENKLKKRNKSKFGFAIPLAIYLGFFAMGIVCGMMLQQAIVKQGIIDILYYSNLDVDINFNSTRLVEEMNNTFIPAWKEAFNKTVHDQLIQK